MNTVSHSNPFDLCAVVNTTSAHFSDTSDWINSSKSSEESNALSIDIRTPSSASSVSSNISYIWDLVNFLPFYISKVYIMFKNQR